MNLKNTIRTIPHFPKQGIMFRDITTLIKDKHAFVIELPELNGREKLAKYPVHSLVSFEGH